MELSLFTFFFFRATASDVHEGIRKSFFFFLARIREMRRRGTWGCRDRAEMHVDPQVCFCHLGAHSTYKISMREPARRVYVLLRMGPS